MIPTVESPASFSNFNTSLRQFMDLHIFLNILIDIHSFKLNAEDLTLHPIKDMSHC